jgi:hypothetical protein
MLVKDIKAGGGSSSPAWLTEMNNKLYFAADDGVKGRELWVSDPALNGLPRQRHRARLESLRGFFVSSLSPANRSSQRWK